MREFDQWLSTVLPSEEPPVDPPEPPEPPEQPPTSQPPTTTPPPTAPSPTSPPLTIPTDVGGEQTTNTGGDVGGDTLPFTGLLGGWLIPLGLALMAGGVVLLGSVRARRGFRV